MANLFGHGKLFGPASSEDPIPNTGDYQWYIDEGSGTTLNPDVGSVSMTISGATWNSENGPVGGQYLSFDGINDNAETDQSIDAAQDTFTVFGWARIDTFSEFDHRLVGPTAPNGSSSDAGWYIFTEGVSGEIGMVIGNGSAVRNVSFPSSGWGFVAAIVDGGSGRLITFDNTQELADSTGSSDRTPRTGDELRLGEDGTGADYYDGDLDFWGFADTQLSKSDLTGLWEATQRSGGS